MSLDTKLWMLDSTNEFLDNGRIYYNVTYGREIVAMCSLGKLSKSVDEFAFINDLFVKEGFRRLGIAEKLINHIICTYRDYKIPKTLPNLKGLICCISSENIPSIKLVEKLGFTHSYTYDDKSRMYNYHFPCLRS